MSRSAGRCSNLSSGTAASFCQRVNLVASDAELFQAGESSLVETPFWCASLFIGTFAALFISRRNSSHLRSARIRTRELSPNVL